MVFQIYPRLNYNIARDYYKLLQKLSGNSSNVKNNKVLYNQMEEQLRILEQRKEHEIANNGNLFI